MRRLQLPALALTLGAALTFLPVMFPASAPAKKRASAAQSRAIWRAYERKFSNGSTCLHRRAVISTVPSRYVWGKIVVADRYCGNGEMVYKRRKGTRRWKFVSGGSDWGFPERCADDLRKLGRSVYQDFFPNDPNCP